MKQKNHYNKQYFARMDSQGILARKGYQKYVKQILLSLPKRATVLDVGCGKGDYLKDIRRARPDLKLVGIDVANNRRFLPKSIAFKQCGGEKMPFKDGTFNFVFCFHVLEHVQHPSSLVQEFHRVMKKGGRLYLEAPYYKTATIPEGSLNFWHDSTHVRPFSMTGFERLLREASFVPERITVLRNWLSILLGPYLLLKRIFLRDYDALCVFCANIVGQVVIAIARK